MSGDSDSRSDAARDAPTVEGLNSMQLTRPLVLSLAMLVVGLGVVAAPSNAADDEFYLWAKWRLGHAPYTCQAGAAWVRPNVRPNVPASWWEQLKQYKASPCPPSGEQPVDTPTAPIAEPRLSPSEAALRNAVNAERRRHGLAALPVGPSVVRAARDHTADMIKHGYLGHDWHNGAPFGPVGDEILRMHRGRGHCLAVAAADSRQRCPAVAPLARPPRRTPLAQLDRDGCRARSSPRDGRVRRPLPNLSKRCPD
jgi:hypothetical protein